MNIINNFRNGNPGLSVFSTDFPPDRTLKETSPRLDPSRATLRNGENYKYTNGSLTGGGVFCAAGGFREGRGQTLYHTQ